MTRLPQPGGDSGAWGNILNDYLSQVHNPDGTLKDNIVTSDAITNGTIEEAQLSSAVLTKLNSVAGTPSWSDITNKPAVIAAGADQAAARAAIGAGTSNLAIGTTSTTAKAGDYKPTLTDIATTGVADSKTFLRGDATWVTPSVTDNRLGFCQSEVGSINYAGFDAAAIESIVAGIKAAGGSRLRFAAWWGDFEPVTRGGFNWTGLDRILTFCETYDIEPIVVIVGNPSPLYSSPTITDFSNACAALATRYGSNGTNQLHNYQVWNEPNHSNPAVPYFGTVPFGTAGYANLLIAVSSAIRAVDPAAFIITAALMSTTTYSNTDISPSSFLTALYNFGAKNAFDAVAYNWYSIQPDFSGYEIPTTNQTFYKELLACRDIMTANNDSSKQVWVTEFGVDRHTVTNPIVRGEILAGQINLLARHDWIGCWLAYNWRDTGNGNTDQETFGLVDHDNSIPQNPGHDLVISSGNVVTTQVANGYITDTKIAANTITGAKLRVSGAGGTGKFLAYAADGSLSAAEPAGAGGGGGLDEASLVALINNQTSNTRTSLDALYTVPTELKSGAAPTGTVHANAGTGAGLSSGGTRLALRATITTGIAPTSGGILATFALSGYTTAPVVAINPRDEGSVATFPYVATTTSVLTLKIAGELEPNTAYSYDMIIMGI